MLPQHALLTDDTVGVGGTCAIFGLLLLYRSRHQERKIGNCSIIFFFRGLSVGAASGKLSGLVGLSCGLVCQATTHCVAEQVAAFS